jgi:hypothetical protein
MECFAETLADHLVGGQTKRNSYNTRLKINLPCLAFSPSSPFYASGLWSAIWNVIDLWNVDACPLLKLEI